MGRNQDIRDDYESGVRPAALSIQHGISPGRVRAVARAAGARMNERGRPRTVVDSQTQARARRMYVSGTKIADIAAAHGLTYWVVRRLLGEAGMISAPKGVTPHVRGNKRGRA